MQSEVLPYTAPQWLTPKRVVLAALLYAPFLGFIQYLYSGLVSGGMRQVAISFTQALIAIPIANWLIRANAGSAFRRAFVGALVTSVIGKLLAALLLGTNDGIVMSVVELLVFSVIQGQWDAWLVRRTLPFRSDGAGHDAVERTVRFASIWAMAPCVLLAVGWMWAWADHADPGPLSVLVSMFFYCIVLSVLFELANARIRARRRWLRRVKEGQEPQWRIVLRPDWASVAPLETGSSSENQRVLVRVHEETVPYRGGVTEVPVASLASDL